MTLAHYGTMQTDINCSCKPRFEGYDYNCTVMILCARSIFCSQYLSSFIVVFLDHFKQAWEACAFFQQQQFCYAVPPVGLKLVESGILSFFLRGSEKTYCYSEGMYAGSKELKTDALLCYICLSYEMTQTK